MRILRDFMKPVSLAAFALLLLVLAAPAASQGIDFRGALEGLADKVIQREKQDDQSSDQQGDQPPDQQTPAQQSEQQVEPSAEREPAQTVDLRSIQQNLARLGYSPGVADGLMGSSTKTAIQEFQRDQGFDVDGVASPQLLERLMAVTAARQSGPTETASTAPPSSEEIDTGDLGVTGAGKEQIAAGAALEGSDAYAALLDLYIREYPDAAQDPEFLPYFAGLGCKAEGWHDKLQINPFEVAEIESAAQSRLDRKLSEASASPVDEAVLITFQAEITAGDYDMAEGVFPIRTARHQRRIKTIRPDDFCRKVATAKGLPNRSPVFPNFFQIGAADEKNLNRLDPSLVDVKPSHIVEMLGGKVAIEHEQARTFYERGYPTIVVEVTGRVRSVARTAKNSAFVTLEPVRATLRTKGNARYSQELAVLGPEQLGSFPDVADFDRDAYYLIGLAGHPPPGSPAMIYYSTSDFDASEANALTGAITGSIGFDPNSIVLQEISFHSRIMSRFAIEGSGSYVLVVGDGWRNRLTHIVEARYPNVDLSVIQIGRAAEAALVGETSGP